MKKLLLLLVLVCCVSALSACGEKTYTISDIFFLRAYKASGETVSYKGKGLGVLALGTQRKAIEKAMGKGQEYPPEDGSQMVYYSGGLTVLYQDDSAVLLDYTLDDTALPQVRDRAFALFKDVNLSSDLADIESKLGKDYFTLSYAAGEVPVEIVYAFEMIDGEYGHQILPNYSLSNADQLRALEGNQNIYAIMLYVDANARYQQLYRIKVGRLADILAFRND